MTTAAPPVRSPNDQLQFLESHRPAMKSGDYTLAVSVTLSAEAVARLGATPPAVTPTATTGTAAAGATSSVAAPATTGSGTAVVAPATTGSGTAPPAAITLGSRTAHFVVAGERYVVKAEDVLSAWPPPGSTGAYQGNLPHLVLPRSTFPWERSPSPGPDSNTSPPWLALVAFAGAEAPTVSTMRADAFEASKPADFVREVTQDPAEQLTTIEVKASLLDVLAPKWDDLKYTAHARRVTREAGGTSETAVLIGNRVLEAPSGSPLTYTVHLVSLEGAYDASNAYAPERTAAGADTVRLVSLFHWEFTVDNEGSFFATVETLDGVKEGTSPTFRLPATVADLRAAELLAAGSVPLGHHFRQGDRSVSWYRGPLVPGLAADGWLAQLPLPARCADACLILDESLGMFDASYAVAWELGKLTALADRTFSVGLARWKRARARNAARLRTELDSAFLPHAAAKPELADFPKDLSAFLANLARLQGVPAAHLVPDERMLPKESLRFVDVDPMWVRAIVDGALSVGRVTAGDAARDADHVDHLPAPGAVSGFLLRSTLVAHYPQLAVAAYGQSDPASTGYRTDAHPDAAAYPPLTVRTFRRLGPDILLVLFECTAPLAVIELHVPPEVLHFGLTSEADGYTRTLRDPATGAAVATVSVNGPMIRTNPASFSGKILELSTLASSMHTAMPEAVRPDVFHPGLFALQMLESAPCFRVRRPEVTRG